MRKKKLLNLSAIILGVLMCFSFSKVQATEITSTFTGETLTRSSLQAVSTTNTLSATTTSKVLGISKNRESGNWYVWNPKKDAIDENGNLIVDENGNVQAQKVWKIATYPSTTSNMASYNDLYYCLNAAKGFGLSNGEMAEGAKDTYNVSYHMKNSSDKNSIISAAEGNLGTNYNKILWILDNSYVSGSSTSTDKENLLKQASSYRDITRNFSEYLSDTLIDNDSAIDLTDEQIEVVQQLAIWHFTNGYNVTSDILYKNGNQITGTGDNYDVGGYGWYFVREGEIVAWKMEALYNYFIEAAPSTYTPVEPTLALSNTNAEIEEDENYYIAGPFSLTKENVSISELEVKLNNTTLSSGNYLIVSSKTSTTNITDYNSLNTFYLKVPKVQITSNQTTINVMISGTYNTKKLTFMTNEGATNQPVVLIKNEQNNITDNTNVNINLTEVSIEKIWNDNNNQDGIRPQSVKVQLYKDGKVYGNSVTLSGENLTYRWDRLLDGYTYTVKELNSKNIAVENNQKYNADYTASYVINGNKTTITNTHTPGKVSKTVKKEWSDNDNQDGIRPASVEVQLYKDGTSMGDSYKVTLNAENNWTHTWNDLAQKENGETITYSIKETKVINYATTYSAENYRNTDTITITNTYTPEKVSKTVKKEWSDNDNQDGIRPASVEVQLYKDGTSMGDSYKVTLNAENNWTYTWEGLAKKENGEIITYSIKETEVTNYTTTYSAENYSNTDTITITNTYTPGKVSKTVKKEWSDNDNQDGIRPASVEVQLYKNGTSMGDSYKVTLNSENNWTHTWEGLAQKENGETITYSIKETEVTNYTTTYSAENYSDIDTITITNTHTPGKVSKTVKKEWSDNDNQDGIRPASVEVQLYKNGTSMGDSYKVTLNTENNWTHTWTNLPEKEDSNTIIYTVEEVNVPNGYSVSYSEDTFTITNTHVPKDLAIQLQKIDEEGNIITSSEATFNITGTEEQNLTDAQTNKGILNLSSQKLISNTFEYIYTIKETDAPIGYNKVDGDLSVKIAGTTKLENGTYTIDTIQITDKDGDSLDNTKIMANYNSELNKVVIKVINTKKTNEYAVKLLKVGEDGTTPISGAWFKINDGQATLISETGHEIAKGTLSENGELNLTYKLEETVSPDGYIKIDGAKEVKINAKVELKDNEYQITEVNLVDELEGITISEENNLITIKVKNEVEITGKYNVVLRKVDENGNILTGAKFEVDGTEYELSTGEVTLLENKDLTSTNDIKLTYPLKETGVPEGYEQISDKTVYIKAKVQKDGNNYKLIRAELVDNEGSAITDETVSIKVESDTIVIVVKNTPIQKKFDLSLRKFITKVNDIEYSREPVVDTSTIATTGTATYKHIKQPIPVQKGDVVTYTIRVYNEGEVDGYVNKITDHLPENLIPILRTTVEDIEKYEEEIEFNENWLWGGDNNIIATEITTKDKASDLPNIIYNETETEAEKEAKQNDARLLKSAYNEDGTIKQELDYIDVQIKCLVTDKAVSGEYLTNIAEITDSQDINGVQGDGSDSELSNATISNLADYKNQEAISSTEDSYIPGQEDDDDFEKLVVKEFDLALRKFITKVNETSYSREPIVDTSKLGTIVDGKIITTASYTHSKEPIIVETNDVVTYTIRIYNEGSLAGYANEITDDIPEGLEFLPNSSVNVSYKWRMIDSEGNETEDVSKAVMIVTDYLSDSDKNNIINAVSENDGVKTLSYKDVEVQFKVIAKSEKLKDNVIKNVAQISADSDRDIDSNPNRDEKYDYTTGNNEDDIDYEPIKLQYFDLALRKFITKVNTTEYNNRYPEITYNEDGSITYKHTKDPVLVTTNDVVVYTIRIYNEGEKAGYATEITDNLPEGLEFLLENEVNKQYGWKLIDSEGNETQDITKAVKFTTNCLKDELIDSLVVENGQKILSYKDVQIAFKVIEPNTSDRILVNTAEISKDSDDDIDSIPGNNILEEDDIDREYVKVQYFDLSLKKWVTKTMVTYNGKTTTTKTGFTEDSEEIAKVDLVASRMKKTTVKFAYNIKVTNEGELPGYAYEVKDYIPKGLKFVAEDNKDWKEIKDDVVVTEKLKDTLLNPGESATVEIVLTWKNSTTNTGLKTNYAEISKDSADDIDSTPDNYNLKEDDIDDAQVILSIKTAGPQTYVGLILLSVTILAGGIFLIKKYVIK